MKWLHDWLQKGLIMIWVPWRQASGCVHCVMRSIIGYGVDDSRLEPALTEDPLANARTGARSWNRLYGTHQHPLPLFRRL